MRYHYPVQIFTGMAQQREPLLTLAQAGEMAGLAPVTLRMLVAQGRIPGQKIGRDWLVAPSDVRTYLKTRRPPGRPSKVARPSPEREPEHE